MRTAGEFRLDDPPRAPYIYYLVTVSRLPPGRRSSVVEQLIRNQQVVGSIPTAGSTKSRTYGFPGSAEVADCMVFVQLAGVWNARSSTPMDAALCDGDKRLYRRVILISLCPGRFPTVPGHPSSSASVWLRHRGSFLIRWTRIGSSRPPGVADPPGSTAFINSLASCHNPFPLFPLVAPPSVSSSPRPGCILSRIAKIRGNRPRWHPA